MRLFEKLKKYKAYIIIGIIIIFLFVTAYEYYHKYMYILRSPKDLKNLIMSYGKYGIFAFLVLQILQVVAFFIPGEFVQIASGYMYGSFLGSVLSVLGIVLGSIIAYLISMIYGKPLVNKMVSNRQLKFFKRILNLGNMNLVVFLVYLIPGIPKDILSYICGISNISLKNFIIYSTLGRLPGIIISSYFGAKIYSENKIMLIIITIVVTMLFFIGIFKGEKIILKMVKHKSSQNDN